MSFKIIDNFLTEEDFDVIYSTFFPKDLDNPNNFIWNYQKGIVRDPKLGPTGYEDNDWIYSRSLYSSENGLIFDKHYPIIKPILNKLKIKHLFDVRSHILVPTKEHIHHEFHIDREISHKVALFYVTTCNGFTILKDIAKINCIKNRILIFNGSIKHQSVTSTDFPRCVVNINYEDI